MEEGRKAENRTNQTTMSNVAAVHHVEKRMPKRAACLSRQSKPTHACCQNPPTCSVPTCLAQVLQCSFLLPCVSLSCQCLQNKSSRKVRRRQGTAMSSHQPPQNCKTKCRCWEHVLACLTREAKTKSQVVFKNGEVETRVEEAWQAREE